MIEHLFFQDSTAVSSPVATTVPAGTLRVPVSLPIVQDTYLYPGSEFILDIVDTVVTAPSEHSGSSGDVSTTSGRVIGVVGEEFANPLVRFSQLSLSASVNDGKRSYWTVCSKRTFLFWTAMGFVD